jgi:hypothetical protein
MEIVLTSSCDTSSPSSHTCCLEAMRGALSLVVTIDSVFHFMDETVERPGVVPERGDAALRGDAAVSTSEASPKLMLTFTGLFAPLLHALLDALLFCMECFGVPAGTWMADKCFGVPGAKSGPSESTLALRSESDISVSRISFSVAGCVSDGASPAFVKGSKTTFSPVEFRRVGLNRPYEEAPDLEPWTGDPRDSATPAHREPVMSDE